MVPAAPSRIRMRRRSSPSSNAVWSATQKVPEAHDAKGVNSTVKPAPAGGPAAAATIISLPFSKVQRDGTFRTETGARVPEEKPERDLHRLPQRDGVPVRGPSDRRDPGAVERRAELGGESRLRRTREEGGKRG